MTAATAVQRLTVPSSGLRAGDVVLTHGMRVRIPEPTNYGPRAHRATGAGAGLDVYGARGVVENPAEAAAEHGVPLSWMREDDETEPHWTIQGNDLATWAVERATTT